MLAVLCGIYNNLPMSDAIRNTTLLGSARFNSPSDVVMAHSRANVWT